jgi:thiamine pyrophosphate-dependent acetolactate synthase large subunit-like protein
VDRPQDIADALREALALDEPSVMEIPVAEHFPSSAPLPNRG